MPKPYWFWQALPQVGKIITSLLQAQESTAIMSVICQQGEIPSVLSVRSCRNHSPLKQGGVMLPFPWYLPSPHFSFFTLSTPPHPIHPTDYANLPPSLDPLITM